MAPQPEAHNGQSYQCVSKWMSRHSEYTAAEANRSTPYGISTCVPLTGTQSPQPIPSSPTSNNSQGAAQTGVGNQNPYSGGTNQHYSLVGNLPPWLLALVIILPIITVVVSAIALFLIIRARKRQREATTSTPETKDLTTRQGDEQAYIRRSSTKLPATAISLSTATESHAQTPANSAPPTPRISEPVILSTTMNNAYFTGLDTADHISAYDARNTTSADIYAHDADSDEPLPPYRPRSVSPLSRNPNMQTSHTNRTSSLARRTRSGERSRSSSV